MNEVFKPGQVVRLRSAGPLMTVAELLPSGKVACVYFDHNELKQITLPVEVLKGTAV